MPNNQLPHINIDDFSQTDRYVSPKTGQGPAIKQQNRAIHGNRIKGQLLDIKEQFDVLKDTALPENIVRDDAVYVEFISEVNYELAFDSLNSNKQNPDYQILNITKEAVDDQSRYRVNVMLTEGGISNFIKKTEQYLAENINYRGRDTGNPKNFKLINNIESIQLATLKGFWTDSPEYQFPEEDAVVWWEVWFRKKGVEEDFNEKIYNQLNAVGASVSDSELVFAEHRIKLVKGSAKQLSESLMLLDNLAELRKPKETADFFTGLTISEKEDAVQELKSRVVDGTNENSIAICLLDSGVQNKHPLLKDFIPDKNLFSVKPDEWGTYDSCPNGGHGTGMAGLAIYGDLTEALETMHPVQIHHQLESVKIFNPYDRLDPLLYGRVTEEATSIPIVETPLRPRVYCMAVTNKDHTKYGRPSSWSAAVDKIIFGNDDLNFNKEIFFISSGNVVIETPEEYPDKNTYESIHDPAQTFNAISVGAYTNLDWFSEEEFPNGKALALKGGMSPANSNSLFWNNGWALKPDIVMEGGNLLNQDGDLVEPDSLRLLTTHKDFRVSLFQSFGDTSGATALASRYAVILKTQYPDLWNESIRGLLIHSAEWTQVMLGNRDLNELKDFTSDEKRTLLRTFGYGVPNLRKAVYSAENSLTMIAQKEIKPFRNDGSIKFNEIHLFELPWPTDILQNEIGDLDVKLNVTLSYFIEPNPGNRHYSTQFSYQSHGLRFNVIKPDEDLETFKKRINKNSRENETDTGYTGEDWMIKPNSRNKGSIHRDFWIGSGAALSTRNCIAVYPTSGWYKTRKKLEKYDSTVRYSLIVSIETPEVDVDIYTPVRNLVAIEV